MDSFGAMYRGMAAKAAGCPQRVFDWEKAATLIAEHKPETARAGLSGDWEYTGGDIWRSGAPAPKEDTYTYLSSNWATPELDMDGDLTDCWRLENDTPGWSAETYWPEEALKIIRGT